MLKKKRLHVLIDSGRFDTPITYDNINGSRHIRCYSVSCNADKCPFNSGKSYAFYPDSAGCASKKLRADMNQDKKIQIIQYLLDNADWVTTQEHSKFVAEN